MRTVGPAPDVLSAGGAPRPAGTPQEATQAPPPPPPRAERVPETEPRADGTPAYMARLRDLLLELLSRLSPTTADALRDMDIRDAIAEARLDLMARERFSAGLELGTGLVVDMLA